MKSNYQKLINHLGDNKVQVNVPLSKYTTFKIGGPAKVLFKANGPYDLIRAITMCLEFGIPYVILGGGSNVLVSDKGFDGLVILNRKGEIQKIDENLLEITSGVTNTNVVKYIIENSLTGLEFIIGIPGTIGGAIRNNGRFRNPKSFQQYFTDFHLVQDQFVCDLLTEVLLLTDEGNIFWADKNYIKPQYHETKLKETKDIIITARFQLCKATKNIIHQSTRDLLLWRKSRKVITSDSQREQPPDPITGHRASQPTLPSPGCVFSNIPNPDNHPVGRMIDMCGLKGTRIGNVMVALEHANYFVNLGNGRASDAYKLITLCKQKVKDQFGVDLHLEIDLIGNFE